MKMGSSMDADAKLSCPACDLKMDDKENYKKHLKFMHPYECPTRVCEFTSPDKVELIGHVKERHPTQFLYCSLNTSHLTGLRNDSFVCWFCDKILGSQLNLGSHLNSTHGNASCTFLVGDNGMFLNTDVEIVENAVNSIKPELNFGHCNCLEAFTDIGLFNDHIKRCRQCAATSTECNIGTRFYYGSHQPKAPTKSRMEEYHQCGGCCLNWFTDLELLDEHRNAEHARVQNKKMSKKEKNEMAKASRRRRKNDRKNQPSGNFDIAEEGGSITGNEMPTSALEIAEESQLDQEGNTTEQQGQPNHTSEGSKYTLDDIISDEGNNLSGHNSDNNVSNDLTSNESSSSEVKATKARQEKVAEAVETIFERAQARRVQNQESESNVQFNQRHLDKVREIMDEVNEQDDLLSTCSHCGLTDFDLSFCTGCDIARFCEADECRKSFREEHLLDGRHCKDKPDDQFGRIVDKCHGYMI